MFTVSNRHILKRRGCNKYRYMHILSGRVVFPGRILELLPVQRRLFLIFWWFM